MSTPAKLKTDDKFEEMCGQLPSPNATHTGRKRNGKSGNITCKIDFVWEQLHHRNTLAAKWKRRETTVCTLGQVWAGLPWSKVVGRSQWTVVVVVVVAAAVVAVVFAAALGPRSWGGLNGLLLLLLLLLLFLLLLLVQGRGTVSMGCCCCCCCCCCFWSKVVGQS